MPTITPLDFEKEIREFRGQLQALKLPPINQSNGFENFFKREDKLHKNLKLLDITTTSKRRKLSRQKLRKRLKTSSRGGIFFQGEKSQEERESTVSAKNFR